MSGEKTRRKLTIEGWLKTRYEAGERIDWDDLWINMAQMIAYRGKCARDRVGAVIIDDENRVLSVGYNGPPAGFAAEGPCTSWCPRSIASVRGEAVSPTYEDCYSLHAENNAILNAMTRPFNGGSIYVSSAVCWQCGVMIANSGLRRVVMFIVPNEHRHREPEKTIDFLTECGLEVVVVNRSVNEYRAIFLKEYGYGPHACYFCAMRMPWVEVVHHKDHDHSNNDPANLAAAHAGCHANYHKGVDPTGWTGSARTSVTTKFTRRKPMLKCKTCDLTTTPGWLRRHAETTGHDGTAYVEWREAENQRKAQEEINRRTCDECGRTFETAQGRTRHMRWSQQRGSCKIEDRNEETRK